MWWTAAMPKANIWEMSCVSRSESLGGSQPTQEAGFLFCIATFQCNAIDAKSRTIPLSPNHHQYLEMAYWVLLGDKRPALFMQETVYVDNLGPDPY